MREERRDRGEPGKAIMRATKGETMLLLWCSVGEIKAKTEGRTETGVIQHTVARVVAG